MEANAVRALTFDVFGTVVDWRTSIAREGAALARRRGLTVDWTAFADAWRGLYQPMPAHDWDVVARDFNDLAARLGC
jgi:2-haloacid dehalogenase